ncbi:MAG: HAD-IIA family hydrolase [Chloroflexi bacterium]|nr:MAG: HAD-IIA family hydrolase [Chloroflexota bacterium]
MNTRTHLDLTQIHGLVIDGDGVLWQENTPLPGLVEFFDFLKTRGIRFMLATNNATKTPEQFLQKLHRFGVSAVKREQILTSSLATAAYLRRTYPPGTRVYVVGQDGLRQALEEAGYILLPNADEPAAAVVAGADFSLTYEKAKYAVFHIRRGAAFIGTNADATFPTPEGLAPGAGSILALLETASGVKPTIVGKPEPLMFEIALEKLDTTPETTAMLGDRLETDILGGQRAGLKTILVTSGVDSEESCRQKGIWPDAIFSGIKELTDTWAKIVTG